MALSSREALIPFKEKESPVPKIKDSKLLEQIKKIKGYKYLKDKNGLYNLQNN